MRRRVVDGLIYIRVAFIKLRYETRYIFREAYLGAIPADSMTVGSGLFGEVLPLPVVLRPIAPRASVDYVLHISSHFIGGEATLLWGTTSR